MSVSEYKNTIFCGSSELIYFVPQDKDAGLKLSGTEYVALKNILENKFSPFVTRTFEYDESNYSRLLKNKIDEINWRRPLVKTIYKDKVLYLPEPNESINGIFLSLLVSQAAQIQIKKLICNGLKFIKSTGQGRDYLKMLEVFTKFNHKIYKVFTTLKIDFSRLWTNFTLILDPNEINENLLLKCLEIDFHDVDLNWKGSQKAFYEVIKGINSYKKRLDEPFNIGDDHLKAVNKTSILLNEDTSQEVIDYFYEMFLLNRDFIEIFHLSLQTGTVPPAAFLEILKEDQTTLENFYYEKPKIISFIENFLRNEEDYEWFVCFLQGEYGFIGFSPKYSKFILRESLSNSSLTLKGLEYFYKGNEPRGVSRLLYKLFKDGKRPEQKYFECIGDYVFVCDHKFIGREYLSQMYFKRKLF
ncbi:hypothetical protein NBO_8g0042 [Nosema bombycis CQ1]|uniref:Uncharacterized protein n=1 Tax=Nosema bombycis (strain CQ1 / CVCC 102059) TaxID=578461 RepID=R0MQK9_NOSB1|nr:hypothetical protein NBO_8g0042 [Nosema bombycis CQ1]|eukprot:EOB15178.1 hypothetical protein NBO_8g0042 [Nosema bombycis CQ1]